MITELDLFFCDNSQILQYYDIKFRQFMALKDLFALKLEWISGFLCFLHPSCTGSTKTILRDCESARSICILLH